jgi:hypothetical protein
VVKNRKKSSRKLIKIHKLCTLDYVGNGKEGKAWIIQEYG